MNLKPCPFCGGEADCNNSGFMQNGKRVWAVECTECGTVSPFFGTEKKATEAWNRRAAVDAVEVVRCKDCKHWERFAAGSDKGICTDGACLMYEDDFCSYGERKE